MITERDFWNHRSQNYDEQIGPQYERAYQLTAERTLAFLASVSPAPFLPQPALPEAPAFAGHAVLCLEWKDARCVNAEDMTDAQLDSFVDGCRRLSGVLAEYGGPLVPPDEDSPERQYAVLSGYAARHPSAVRLLRPLLAISSAICTA